MLFRMPARNIYKTYVEDAYYHVYNRGVNKEPLFLDEQDKSVFLGLLKRYLDPSRHSDRKSNGGVYACYNEEVELLAYCLMRNHFHLFVYQYTADGMRRLVRSVSISYGMYFNKKYKRVGPIFQQRYRAVMITTDAQLMHITRYIHLNPKQYRTYEWSSMANYDGRRYTRWVRTHKILELFDRSPAKYVAFVDEYKDRRDDLAAQKIDFAG